MRELFYAPPARTQNAIIEPIAFMLGDEEIIVRTRKGSGYVVLAIAFSRLRYSYGVEDDIRRALSDSFGPVSFHTFADCGAVSLLLFYFDVDRLDHPIDEAAVRRHRRAAGHNLGGPRVRCARGRIWRTRRTASVPTLRHSRNPERPVSRSHAARNGSRGRASTSTALSERIEVRHRSPLRGIQPCFTCIPCTPWV